MNFIEALKKFDPGKMLGWISHLDFVSRFLTGAFSSGKSKDHSQQGVHEAYKQMADEAIDLTTHEQLNAELERDGYTTPERADIFHDMGKFFHEHRWFVDGFRESMAVITDLPTRIANLKHFALADDERRLFLCQQIDDRSGWARYLVDRFVEASRIWNRVIRGMSLERAERLYTFLAQLPFMESRQFATSIGALKLESDRNACLDEVLAAHPNMERMREIAMVRGLIKPGVITLTGGRVVHGYRTLENFFNQIDTPEGKVRAATSRAKQVAEMNQDSQKLLVCRFVRWIFS
ncbi:MAG: hypothetical protein COU72_01315 [Parcubacteria group bacterium CG10_big_fil_rev_8_21_14_0_10_41_35]|nr:MAG: hypothetical protein COU72_01315 [Parcubacteria group bacterium CG10_big_fil_rev_8_21_14_0_10_41_35]